jgi:hypothetical protein
MKTIVILSDSPEADNGLVSLLENLFPKSQIRVLSRETAISVNSQESPESAKSGKGGQKNVEHSDRR